MRLCTLADASNHVPILSWGITIRPWARRVVLVMRTYLYKSRATWFHPMFAFLAQPPGDEDLGRPADVCTPHFRCSEESGGGGSRSSQQPGKPGNMGKVGCAIHSKGEKAIETRLLDRGSTRLPPTPHHLGSITSVACVCILLIHLFRCSPLQGASPLGNEGGMCCPEELANKEGFLAVGEARGSRRSKDCLFTELKAVHST